MVISEFKLLAEGSCVYKLVGPILAKQELSEATENVTKRIEFMDKEIARQDALESEFQEKITTKSNNIKQMQADFQKMAMQASQAADQQMA